MEKIKERKEINVCILQYFSYNKFIKRLFFIKWNSVNDKLYSEESNFLTFTYQENEFQKLLNNLYLFFRNIYFRKLYMSNIRNIYLKFLK